MSRGSRARLLARLAGQRVRPAPLLAIQVGLGARVSATALAAEWKRRGDGTVSVSLALGQNAAPHPEPTSTDKKTEGAGETPATLRCGGSSLFNEGSSEVVFSEGRMHEELCFLPAASRTDRAPEGVSLSAPGPAANLAKCFLVFANGEARAAAAAVGAGCQVPRGNPGVRQVSSSALEKWPPSRMRVAQSLEGSCVPPTAAATVGR